MKLRYKFETVDMQDEIIAVAVGENAEKVKGVVKLNKSGLEIFNMLQNDTSIDAVVNVLAQEYDDEKQELYDYTNRFISILNSSGLIVE